MEEGTPLYCENDECSVLVYLVRRAREAATSLWYTEKNCPACGRFGRKKGRQ